MAEEQILDGGKPKPELKQFYLDIKDHVEVPSTYEEFEKTLLKGDNLQKFYNDIKGTIEVPDDFIKFQSTLIGGTNPAEKKNVTASPSTLAGGISNAMQGRTNAAIDAATTAPTPYSLNQVATERKKKVELNKGLKGAAQSYKDYKAANENLRNAQMDLTAGLQGEKDVIQTDVLGKPVAIQGSLTEQKIKGLQENVDLAKANKKAAKETLIKVAPAFKDKNIDIVAELQKDNTDVEETVIPQAVEKIKFVEDISDLEDNLKQNGQTLDDWSKYVDTEAPKEFLDDKQRALYDVVKTGDEGKIKQAQELYFKDIDDEVRGIDGEITKLSVSGSGAIGTGQNISGQIAELRQKKQDLLDKKQGFLQPSVALKQVAEIDPSFGAFDEMFAKISPNQRVKMTLDKLYADKIKEQARLGTTSDYAQRRQAGTGFSQITPTGQIDTQEKLRKIDQAIKILAPIAFLNQTPDMEQSNWTRFGRGVWNTIAGDATGTTLPKKEDIADSVTSLMTKAGALDNISSAGQKALKATAPTLTDKAIDMASYITSIAPSYGAIGSAMQGAKIPQLVRMAFGNIGKYSPLLGRVTPYLSRMTSEGITSELTGRALGGAAQQDLTFLSKAGAQGVTEFLNKSPFGKLVNKAVNSLGIKEVPKFVTTLANINSAGTGSLIEEGVEEGIVMYQNSDSFADFKKQLKQFVDSPSDLFLFVASSYALGGFTSGLSPNVSNKFYQAADKAYSDLPPDEKTAFDNVVKDVNQGQEDAVMEVVLKTVDKVPNKVVDGLVTDLNTAIEELGKTEVGEDGYEVKIGDTVYQGNTIQDLQNDIDDAQSLLAIYKGEQDNRTQNGIIIEEAETPPIAEADQTDVEQPKPEAGVGVEGDVVPEDVKKRITELEDMLSGDALSMQEKGMGTLVDRQSVVDELADLKKKYNIEPKPIAKAAPTFENVPVFTYTPQDVEKAKNEVFDNLSKLQVGSVIENSDGEIKVVTENLTSKKGNRLIGVVTFTRLEDGSLLQTTNPVFASKSADGKIKLDYNPHTTGRNAKGEQVTVTDQITDKTIDLSKENIFIEDENGNLVKTNAFSTTTNQAAPTTTTQTQPSDTANLPQDVQDKIAKLRAQEQTDLRNALPNYENYLTDGKVDDKKITNDADLATFNKIYDQYNAPITALVESAKNQPQNVQSDERNTFYTGRGKKYENLKQTKGDFIFFSKNPNIAEWYGGDKENVTETKLDTSKFIDLTTQDKKSEYVEKYFTDQDIQELYPNIKRNALEDRDVRVSYDDKLKQLTDKKREQLKENRFSGDNKEQKFLLNKLKKEGYSGVKLLDTHFGKSDISYVVIDKNVIKQENQPQEVEVKETVSEKQGGETISVEEGNITSPEEFDELEKFYKEEERKAGSEYPQLSYKEEFIHKNIGRVDAQQLIDGVGEKAFKDGKMALRFTKKGAEPIDTVADVLSQDAGVEITPQDIFDYFLDRTAFGGRYVKQKVKRYADVKKGLDKIEKQSPEIQNKILDLSDEGKFADNLDINSPDVLAAAEFLFDGEDLALIKEELNRLQLPQNESERNQLRQSLQAKRKFQSNLRTGEGTEIEGTSETTPTEKIDEKRESPKATETDLGKKQGAPKKQAIPTESIDNLVKGGTKRKAALENITEPKIADVAKALTDTKGLAKIMDILNGDDIQALNDLENSIGFKKIC